MEPSSEKSGTRAPHSLRMRRLRLAKILKKNHMLQQENFVSKKPTLRTFLILAGTASPQTNLGAKATLELRLKNSQSQSPLLSSFSCRKKCPADASHVSKPRIPKFMTTLSIPHFLSPCPSRGTIDITVPFKDRPPKEDELNCGNYAGRLVGLILEIIKHIKRRSDDIRLLSNSAESSNNLLKIELYEVEQLLEKIELNEQARSRQEAQLLSLLEQVRVEEHDLKK